MTPRPRIEVTENGPYRLDAGIPVRRKRAVVTPAGEPVGWEADDVIPTEGDAWLCRCGGSSNKPFCDGTHRKNGFDGTQNAPSAPSAERADSYPAGDVTVVDDRAICEHAGFCGTKVTNVWKMTARAADDADVRAEMVAMIERCPSGALTYVRDGAAMEPDLPVEVGVIDDGPLSVTGGVEVVRSDGQPMEVRNRVTLCRCGHSAIKPLCDGSHAKVGFSDRPPEG